MDQDLFQRNASQQAQVPEYQMMSFDRFRLTLKSYCKALETPQTQKLIKNPERLVLIDYSQPSHERRLYVLDLKQKKVLHHTWTTHAYNSSMNFWLSLKDSGLAEFEGRTRETMVSYQDSPNAAFFSNQPGSEQSSVGLAVAEAATYYSTQRKWNALRMTGVDGELNDKLKSRAIVFHEWNYSPTQIRAYQAAPFSWGCPMLPTSGSYQGESDVEIAKRIMNDMRGAVVVMVHDRMLSKTENEAQGSVQSEKLSQLLDAVNENVESLAGEETWSIEVTKQVRSSLRSQVLLRLQSRIEATKQYFQSRSKFIGVEPETDSCLRALSI